jgi:hypothetical protein
MYGYFAKRTDPPQHPYSSGCSSLPSGLRLPPSPTHSSRRSLGHTAFTALQVIFGSPTTVRGSLATSLPLIGSLTPVSPEDSASPPEVTRCSSVPCRPQTPWCDGVNENAFVSIVQTRPYPTFGRPVHLRGSPHRLRPGTSPHALRIPSRDGHPALRRTASDGFRYALAVSGFRLRARLGVTIPFSLPGQRGVTPAFGYSAPHSSARGTLTLLNNALLSAHYEPLRHPIRPGLSLASCQLIHPAITAGTSRVAYGPLCLHAVANTPAGLMEFIRSYDSISFGLPTNRGGSAPALSVSGPAQRSLALRPARSPSRLATLCTRGFSSFVASTTALIATGWSEPVPGRVTPAVDHRLFTTHPVTRLTRQVEFLPG